MDNLTHSMVGAMLGQMGLKRRSGLGMPTIIIAANIPDIDATCTLLGTPSLAMRRGLTHGPIAMLLLPVALAAIMLLFDRWQTRRGTRPADRSPVRFRALWLIALVGTLSHPAFDWMNSYGIRLLSPFSEQWFYGDTLFIIDLWLWALLIGGYIWTRRGERIATGQMVRRAGIIVGLACAYILANGVMTGVAEARAAAWLAGEGRRPDMVVANPMPFAPWRRDMLWRGEGHYGQFGFNLFDLAAPDRAASIGSATGLDDPGVEQARQHNRDARAFLFWSRMPLARRDANGDLLLSDQRFQGLAMRGGFSVRVPAEDLR